MLFREVYGGYNRSMKQLIWAIIVNFFLCCGAYAAEDSTLRFSAVNAGYKNEESSQNYDFIELYRPSDELPHSLAEYQIIYTNSSGNPAGEFTFGPYDYMASDCLVLGFKSSPQYQDVDQKYLYNFSSSGLASTAGKLELFYQNELIDEVCWGKIDCAQQFPKFATNEADNQSIILLPDVEPHFAEIDPTAIIEILPESPPLPSCPGLVITEIFSYYQEDSSEQFVELYNPTAADILLDNCRLTYKKKSFPLVGTLAPGQYYAFQDDDLLLTKSPTKDIVLSIVDANDEIVASATYGKKQKRGTSFALFDAGWRQTYAPTPAALNIFQEYQTCEDGKVINPATGNCVNPPKTTAVTACKVGYYRSPETGRCRKIASTTTSACKDGYERNPETGRCKKIITETGQSYAPTPTEPETHQDTQIFIAISAVIATAIGATIYIIIQFRHEFSDFFRRLLKKTV